MCVLRWSDRENFLWHVSHWNGFTPKHMYSKHAHTFSTSSHKHIRKTHIQHHTQTHTQREIEKYSRAKACREAIPKFGQHLATSSEVSSVQCTNERKTLKTALSLKINKTKTKPSCKKQRRARRERERKSKRPGRNKKWSQTARGSKTGQTCVPPLVSFKLVRARKSAATVCELTLVGFLPWTETRKRTQRINLDILSTYFITYSQLVTLAVMEKSSICTDETNRPVYQPSTEHCCNVISHAGTPTLILPKITYKNIFHKNNTIELKRVAQNMILHGRSHCSVTLNEWEAAAKVPGSCLTWKHNNNI